MYFEMIKTTITKLTVNGMQMTHKIKNNLKRKEILALKSLKNYNTIVILPADKDKATVL